MSESFNNEDQEAHIMNPSFEDIRHHAISTTTLASVIMSQIDEVAIYAPVAAAVAFLFAATGYSSLLKAAETVVDALETAEVIDEDLADKVEEVIDMVEEAIEEDSE
tara:strand:- start:380 stop:700 length:321 start_codon:yes stop_codon:yes gene_type:complete